VTALAEDVALDVDLDAEVPCAEPACSFPAAWLFDNLACEHSRGVPMCNGHKRAVDLMARYVPTFGHIRCTTCKTPSIIRWRPL
jgi:hypothetical protein